MSLSLSEKFERSSSLRSSQRQVKKSVSTNRKQTRKFGAIQNYSGATTWDGFKEKINTICFACACGMDVCACMGSSVCASAHVRVCAQDHRGHQVSPPAALYFIYGKRNFLRCRSLLSPADVTTRLAGECCAQFPVAGIIGCPIIPGIIFLE